MESYLEQYKYMNQRVDEFKKSTLNGVVNIIKWIETKPLSIGNMVYFYCTDENGNEVPAYCYKSDYIKGGKFLPIYDENNTGEFGWSDFEECCRIFEVIRKECLKY